MIKDDAGFVAVDYLLNTYQKIGKTNKIVLGSYSAPFHLLIFMAKWPSRLFNSLVGMSSIFLTSWLPYLLHIRIGLLL